MDLRSALRSLNLGLDIQRCPECNAVLERDRVRSPSQQEHWRGVEANVCPECDYAEAVDDEPITP